MPRTGLGFVDGGQSLTSGFQSLHDFLLNFLYSSLLPGPNLFLQAGILLSSLLTLLSAAIEARAGWTMQSPFFMLLAALIFSSKNVAVNSISSMD